MVKHRMLMNAAAGALTLTHGKYIISWDNWVCGPFSTSTLSINQIPSVATGLYVIDLYVTFDAGTLHRIKKVNLSN